MRENYVKVSFVVFSADRQPEVRKGHTLLGCSILFKVEKILKGSLDSIHHLHLWLKFILWAGKFA